MYLNDIEIDIKLDSIKKQLKYSRRIIINNITFEFHILTLVDCISSEFSYPKQTNNYCKDWENSCKPKA